MAELKEGLVTGAMNLFFIYKFLRILTTPWEDSDAFKLGIVDENGKILKKKSQLKTMDEKDAYTMMHRLVWKIKRLMEKVPFGKTRLASYAAALWLIKEGNGFKGDEQQLQESMLDFIEKDEWKEEAQYIKEEHDRYMNKKSFSKFLEERSLTPDEEKKKEEIVKKLKNKLDSFKTKYGDDAKSVMYGIATKQAKEEEVAEEVFHWYIVQGNTQKGKVSHVGTERQLKLKIRKPIFPSGHVLMKSRKDLKIGDKWKGSYMPEGFELDEGTVLDIKDVDKWIPTIKKGVDAPWVSVQKSTLGGDENVALMIKISLDPEKDWTNKIYQNSRYAMIRLGANGEMEMFASDRSLKNMRKTKFKSDRDVVSKINTWIKKVDESVEAEAFYDKISLTQINSYLKNMSRLMPNKELVNYLKKKWDLKKITFNSNYTKILAIEAADYMDDPNGIDDTIGKEKKLYPSGDDIEHDCDKVHPDMDHNEWEGLADEEEPNEEVEVDEYKQTIQQKIKRKKWLRTSGGRASLRKKKKYAAKIKSGSRRVNKSLSRSMKKSRRKAGYRRDDLQHTEETMKTPSFKEFIAEGRAKLSPEDQFDREGVQQGDRAKSALVDAQQKAYTLRDIQSLARKHKVTLDGDPVGGTKDWDYEWQIAIRGGINLEYKPRSNSFEIKGWKVDKKKLKAYKDKYEPAGTRMQDVMPMGGKMMGRGFETALELIGEETEVRKVDFADWIKDDITEEFSEKDFDSLKKGDTITIEYKSSMSNGKATFKVTAKNVVGKARVEKATLQSVKKPGGVKFFLYKRGNKVSLAQGDMAASVVKYTVEEVELDEGTSLQVKMALSDVGLKGTWKNNKVYVKKKDVKKAEKALKGNVIYKGKPPIVVGEDAPANNVGDGNIDLTPHKKKKKIETEEFSGSRVFIVSPDKFWQARLGKSRYTRYEKYVGNDDMGEAIREYGRSNPKAPIILKNSQNGSMLYLKYGKRG